jgi:MFS family permease
MLLPSAWLAVWNVATPAGLCFGGLVGGIFQDRAGRRLSLAVGSLVAAAGIAIMFCCFTSEVVDTCRGLFLGGNWFRGLD